MTETSAKKEQLMEAALEHFVSKGFHGTSIRDIANSINARVSIIYHHFGNKEGLLQAISERYSRELLEQLRSVVDSDSDPLEKFRALVTRHVFLVDRYEREAKIFFLDEEHLSPQGVSQNKEVQNQILNIYRGQLLSLRAAGRLRPGNLTVIAMNVLGTVNWPLRWFRSGSGLDLKLVAREVVDFVLHGMVRVDTKGPELGR